MMSLKGFHIFFVLASILLAFGVGLRETQNFLSEGKTADGVVGIGSFLLGVSLAAYLFWFVKKAKHIKQL